MRSEGRRKINVVLVGVVVTIVAAIPLMMLGLWKNGTGHDMFFHLLRIEGICEGIKNGQFPVKIQPGWYNGYGYACSVFYGDVFLWIPALLHLAGLPLQTSYKAFVFLSNLGTFYIAYISIKGIFKDGYIASFGAAWYTLSLYRMINVYIRHAVGEHTAMMFFPLIGYALFCLLNEKPERARGEVALILGVTGILQSHIISFEISICVIAIVCLIYINRSLKKEIILSFLKAVALTVLINLWFLVPFLDYMKTGSFIANTINEYKMSVDIGDSGLFLKQIFGICYDAGGVNLPVSRGTEGEMPLGVGIGSAIVLIPGFWVICKRWKNMDEKQAKLGAVMMTGALVSLWLASIYFPWGKLEEIHKVIRYAIINIQFPWRFLGISSVLITLLACFALSERNRIVYMLVSVSFAVLLLSDAYMLYDETRVSDKVYVYDIEDLNTCEPSGEEYLPYGTNVNELLDEDVRVTNVTIEDWEKKYLTFAASIANNSDETGYVLTPLLYYAGYKAIMEDGERSPLEITYGINKRALITIPGGTKGILRVYWSKPIIWRISEIISLISIVLMIIYKCLKKSHSEIFPNSLINT